jgi:DNA-binding winged helix-turn-helix (wHTH) protein
MTGWVLTIGNKMAFLKLIGFILHEAGYDIIPILNWTKLPQQNHDDLNIVHERPRLIPKEIWDCLSQAGYAVIKSIEDIAGDHHVNLDDENTVIAHLKSVEVSHSPKDDGYTDEIFQFGDLTIDFNQFTVFVREKRILLTAKENKLIYYLVKNIGKVLSRNYLLEKVWGGNFNRDTRVVDVHIANLRNKIEPNPRFPRYIMTVHGAGYKFVTDIS